MARPGDLSSLRDEGQQSHRQNDDACPVMVVLGPSLFGGSVRAGSGLAGNVGFGRERTGFECFFLSGVDIFGQLLNGRTGESWRAWRHAGKDFLTGDTVVSEIGGGRERGEWSGGEDYGNADANFGFAEAPQAGKNGTGRSAADELKIERAKEQKKAKEEHFGGDHRPVGSTVNRFE